MQPSILEKVLPYAVDYFGKNVRADREFLIDRINEVRMGWWKVEELRQLIFKRVDCACIMPHNDPCNRTCNGAYRAITLPVGAVGLQHVEWGGRRIPINVKQAQIGGNCGGFEGYAGYPGRAIRGGCQQVEQMTERFPLEKDIPLGYKGGIQFVATEPKDNGKLCGVEYLTATGDIMREDIALSTDGNSTKQCPVKFLKITLPVRCGFVNITTFEGYVLGSYHPAITAPSHMRVRVDGVPNCRAGGIMHWEGLMEPLDVWFDTDRVESGNPLDWRNSFMWINLHFKTGRSPSESAALAEALSFAKAGGETELKATQSTPVGRIVPNGVRKTLRGLKWLQRW